MSFTPNTIFEDFSNGDIDKNSALELLISIINNSDQVYKRLESIKVIHKLNIKSKYVYNILENLLISDNDDRIKMQSAKTLIDLYKEEALPPIRWVLLKNSSLIVKINLLNQIAIMDNTEVKRVLLKILNLVLKKKYKYNLKVITNNSDLESLNIKEIAEIITNYLVISSLKLKFGYIKFDFNNEGAIIHLDLSHVDYQGLSLNKLFKSLEAILSLSSLKKLDLSNNNLKILPEILNTANQLEELNLGYNHIYRLPESVSNLSRLRMLNLKSNQLKILPENIHNLNLLEFLILRDNLLNQLPSALGKMKQLKLLDLHHNKLHDFIIDFDTPNN